MPNTDHNFSEEIIASFGAHTFSEKQLCRFNVFLRYLHRENLRYNLSGVKTIEQVFELHVLDSLAPLLFSDNCGILGDVIDLGSGAGVPGGILSIALGEKSRVSSIERTRKKIDFQIKIKKEAELSNFFPLHMDLRKRPPRRYDCFIARAVADTEKLLKAALPCLKSGGNAVFWKGPKWTAEWSQCSAHMKSCFSFLEARRYDFSGSDRGGYLLLFRKGFVHN